jgi:hypothetical protein
MIWELEIFFNKRLNLEIALVYLISYLFISHIFFEFFFNIVNILI